MSENDLAASLEAACGGIGCMSITSVNGEPHLVFGEGARTVARRMLDAACEPLKAVAAP